MAYQLTRAQDIPKKEKHEMSLAVYPDLANVGVVVAETTTGHNQEFLDPVSTYAYIVLDGAGSFFLDDEEVPVSKGDLISIEPNTRIYYKGSMRILLLTTPAWRGENWVEIKPKAW